MLSLSLPYVEFHSYVRLYFSVIYLENKIVVLATAVGSVITHTYTCVLYITNVHTDMHRTLFILSLLLCSFSLLLLLLMMNYFV